MPVLLRFLILAALCVVVAGCSGADNDEVGIAVAPSVSQPSVDLFETSRTTEATDGSATHESAPEPLALEEDVEVVVEYRAPTTPDAPGCVAATALLFDSVFRTSDDQTREAALIEATTDLLGEAKQTWLSVRDEMLGDDADFETRAAATKLAFEAANEVNRITWQTCGLPILDIDDLLTTSGCFASLDCDERNVWAETLPCFEMKRFTLEIGPEVSLDQETYQPVDCDTTEPLELDRDGTWRAQRSLDETMQLTDGWVVATDIAAGTSSAQALADSQIVRAEIHLDQWDPRGIVDPDVELQGLVASRDLPSGHLLVAGDFIAP